MGDNLGDRMKEYERAGATKARPLLPILARIDGKCFHGLAKHFLRPFDHRVHACFRATTQHLILQVPNRTAVLFSGALPETA